jgi:hypothetical protein
MSIPRCWPAANGSGPVLNAATTGPRTGQRQLPASAVPTHDIQATLAPARVATIGRDMSRP